MNRTIILAAVLALLAVPALAQQRGPSSPTGEVAGNMVGQKPPVAEATPAERGMMAAITLNAAGAQSLQSSFEAFAAEYVALKGRIAALAHEKGEMAGEQQKLAAWWAAYVAGLKP